MHTNVILTKKLERQRMT